MKILYIDHNNLYGGGQKQLLELIKGISDHKKNIKITVLISAKNYKLKNDFENLGIRVYTFNTNLANYLGDLSTLFYLSKKVHVLLKSIEYDIIYTNSFLSSLVCSFLKRGNYEFPKIIYAVMNPYYYSNYGLLSKFVFNSINNFIFNSAYTKNSYEKFLSSSEDSIINYSIVSDPNQLVCPKKVSEILRNKEKKKVGFVGRVVPRKNLELFIKAALKIREQINCEFEVVGPIDDREYFSNLMFKYEDQIAGVMEFTGFIDNPFNKMKSFDLLLVTSHGEAFGRVVLESIYLDTPVIAVEPSGATEVINDEVGKAVKANEDLIARKAIEILNENQTKFSKEDIINKFNPKSLIENEIKFYDRVLEK